MSESSHPFDALTPDFILDAVESLDLRCDGRLFGLNSYENRVYQVGIDDETPLIAKFYRPGRWSDAQILEEHAFCAELMQQELSVVAPLIINDSSIHHWRGFTFTLYPRRGGHAPALDNPEHLEILGRFLGRLHAIGSASAYKHRLKLDLKRTQTQVQWLLDNCIPKELAASYRTLTADVLQHCRQRFEACRGVKMIRLHGDFHVGNILWRDDIPHVVDFDDTLSGPAMQDIWMLLSGEREQRATQLLDIIEGYQDFADFPQQQLPLIEVLQAMRLINHCAWIAQRWDDPAFPLAFPQFAAARFWSDHLLSLREQLDYLQRPPLALPRV